MIPAEKVYTELGSLEVLAVFSKTPKGLIIGGKVNKGVVQLGATARVLRGEDVIGEGSLEDILDYHRSLHNRILHEMADLSDGELWALSRFWEPEPLPVRYRLHRFDAHLRQHTIQIEKTLEALGSSPNEAVRLLRLVYNALAEAEGAVIGAWDFGYTLQEELAAQIAGRSEEVSSTGAGS